MGTLRDPVARRPRNQMMGCFRDIHGTSAKQIL